MPGADRTVPVEVENEEEIQEKAINDVTVRYVSSEMSSHLV